MTVTSITTWEAFADATLTHQDAARKMGRELAASTPPIALARRARHRKPGTPWGVIAKVAGAALLVAALFALIVTAPKPTTQASAFYGLTPGQVSQLATTLEQPGYVLVSDTVTANAEWHACHMAVLFERAARADELTSGAAWHHAWDASGHADPDLKRAIRRYLDSGHGWSRVMWLCGSGL